MGGGLSSGSIGAWASSAFSLAVTAAAAMAEAVGSALTVGVAVCMDGAINTSGGVIA